MKDIYIALNDNSKLFLFQRIGSIVTNKKSIKIKKDIARVLCFCLKGYSLSIAIEKAIEEDTNNAMFSEKERDNKKKEDLLGILALLIEGNLVYRSKPENQENLIVDEQRIYYPQSIHIELTKVCNLKCYYCYRDSGPNNSCDFIDTEKLKYTITELSKAGLSVVEITGGEPLLHPDFFEILSFCIKEIPLVSILTNGTLITDTFIREILPYKEKVIFSISLDSYLEAEHERKSGIKGSFNKTISAIKSLSHLGFIVRASMAVDEGNWNQIEKTLLFSKSIGASMFTYSPIVPVGRAKNIKIFDSRVPKDEIINTEKKILNEYSDFLHILDEDAKENLSRPGGCGAGSRTYVLSPSGEIRMCPTYDNKGILGNVFENSIKSVFENVLCNINASLVLPNIEYCGGCQYSSLCCGCSLRTLLNIQKVGRENCTWLNSNEIAQMWYNCIEEKSIPNCNIPIEEGPRKDATT